MKFKIPLNVGYINPLHIPKTVRLDSQYRSGLVVLREAH